MPPCDGWRDEIVLLLMEYIGEMELLFFLHSIWSLCVSKFELELKTIGLLYS